MLEKDKKDSNVMIQIPLSLKERLRQIKKSMEDNGSVSWPFALGEMADFYEKNKKR